MLTAGKMPRFLSAMLIVLVLLAACAAPGPVQMLAPTATLKPLGTPTVGVVTVTPSPVAVTPTETPISTNTPTPFAATATPTAAASFTPWPPAPACVDHDNSTFHTLWNAALGCHYDHEHGQSPFTQAVADTFPGFDLFALLGGVQVGSTNPSSPAENVAKHGGMKWDVNLNVPCEPFESAQWCVTAAAVQYHNFGNYSVEFESRIHSTVILVKACDPANLSDCGYMFAPQHQEYGQRVTCYQGQVIPYPDSPQPAYGSPSGPYVTIDSIGPSGCRESRQFVLDRRANSNSLWTSKPTGAGPRPPGSTLFKLLFRVRDVYQLFDTADLVHPFTFVWLCSDDGGLTYAPAGCRYTNSTTRVHEVAGTVPAEWDNFLGFDTDLREGRITATGWVTRFGTLAPAGVCLQPGADCFPVKLSQMFVGSYGGPMPGQKISNPTPLSNPSRNIYFCAGIPCLETDSGAVPSSWIGQNN
jgi:hypothetical protein